MLKKLTLLALGAGLLAAPTFALALSADVQSQIDALLAQIKDLNAQIAALEGTPSTPTSSTSSTSSSCVDISRSLAIGSTGSDVTNLQNYLIGKGYLASGNDTGYYSTLTADAVGKLQLDLGVINTSSSLAYGILGPKTRAAIGCGGTVTPTATLTANGGTNVNINVGDTVKYMWSSTSGSSYKFTVTPDDGVGAYCGWNGPYTVAGGLDGQLSDGSDGTFTSAPHRSCWAGHSFTVAYAVTGSDGQTVTASVVVNVSAVSLMTPAPSASITASVMFSNPEAVSVEGYNGPEEDPTISPDGTMLFFDSHTDDQSIPVKLYWAKKLDYKTFQFMGEIGGVNQPGIKALSATLDTEGNLYFDTTLFNPPLLSKARGRFENGTVTGVTLVQGLPASTGGGVNPGQTLDIFGGFTTFDGNRLYLGDIKLKVDSSGSPSPIAGGKTVLYVKNPDGSFTKASGSDEILKNINAVNKVIYGAIEAKNGLALFFTGSDVPSLGGDHIRIYVAQRSSTSEPFGVPEEIMTPWRAVEAAFPSPDGKYLYFHRILSASDAKIYVMTTPAPTASIDQSSLTTTSGTPTITGTATNITSVGVTVAGTATNHANWSASPIPVVNGRWSVSDPAVVLTPGTYPVSVYDAHNASNVLTTGTLTVSSSQQTTSFTASPTSGPAPLFVQFTSSSGGAVSFGDGTSGTMASNNATFQTSHTYQSAGTYQAILSTTCPASQPQCPLAVLGSATITVTGQQTTSFTASPTSGTAPLAVTFTAGVSDASTGRYSVTFGDGTTGTLFGSCIPSGGQCIADGTVSHTYTQANTYTASLISSGTTLSTATVTVTSGGSATAPTISSVSPTTGSGLVPITITGAGFDPTTNYVFLAGTGGVCGLTPLGSTDTTHLSCNLATYAFSPGTYNLTVRNGTTNLTSNTASFTVGTSPTPVVSSMSPTSAMPGTTITIVGTGFDTTATNDVNVGGTHVRNLASTAGGTTLAFALPSMAPGTYSVRVSNGAGVFASWVGMLTVTASASAPVISTVTGAGGLGFTAGTSISTVITGSGFDSSSNWVSFNGGGVGNYPSTNNGTQISFSLSTVGVAAGTYPLMVRNNTNNLYSNSFNIAVGAQTAGSPTAGLSVQYVNSFSPANRSDVTVNPGDNLTYVWSSTGGTSATATYTVDSNDSCGNVAGVQYTWSDANGSFSGSENDTVLSCEAGHTYTITYTVTGTAAGTAVLTTASATITIRVASTAPTATLTVSDGITTGTNITVNPGAAITYTWSSTNGTSYSSVLTAPFGGCFTSLDTSSVIGSSNTNGIRYAYTSSPLGSCWNGHSYTETFTVTGSGGESATASATVNVRSTAAVSSDRSAQIASAIAAYQALVDGLKQLLSQLER